MDPIAGRIVRRTVIDDRLPCRETRWIRFPTEEVYILLAHEERCLVDGIWAIGSLVIVNRNCGAGRRSQSLLPPHCSA